MRLGVVGPSQDPTEFGLAIDLLLGRFEADVVIYVGQESPVTTLDLNDDDVLKKVSDIALQGDASAIRQIAKEFKRSQNLARVQRLPKAPARALEMIDDRIVIFVYNKADLDEDDVFNSNLVVYGSAEHHELHRFGPRLFFSPGPLAGGRLGLISTPGDGRCTLELLDMDGQVHMTETVQGRAAKMSVS